MESTKTVFNSLSAVNVNSRRKNWKLPAIVPIFKQHADDPLNYMEKIEVLGQVENLDEGEWFRMILKVASEPVVAWYKS